MKRTIFIAILISISTSVFIMQTTSNAENSTHNGTGMSEIIFYPFNVQTPDTANEPQSDTVTINLSLMPSPMSITVTDTASRDTVYFVNNSGKTVYIVGTDTVNWNKEFGSWFFEVDTTCTSGKPYPLDITNDVRDTTVNCTYTIQLSPNNKSAHVTDPAVIVVTGGGGNVLKK